jgi:hypothetical protein
VLLLSQALVPNMYFLLARGHPAAVIVLAVRNLGLVIVFAWLLLDWWRSDAPTSLVGSPGGGSIVGTA